MHHKKDTFMYFKGIKTQYIVLVCISLYAANEKMCETRRREVNRIFPRVSGQVGLAKCLPWQYIAV